jgi:DNA-binding PadR family transcriptional regulator
MDAPDAFLATTRRFRQASNMGNTDLYSGLIRLHILHHAAKEPVFGLGIIEELGRHGYRLSAGTLYPMLHAMEDAGYLRSRTRAVDGKLRRNYLITSQGRVALLAAKEKVRELFGELFEDD